MKVTLRDCEISSVKRSRQRHCHSFTFHLVMKILKKSVLSSMQMNKVCLKLFVFLK
jgi:hypothetical protein